MILNWISWTRILVCLNSSILYVVILVEGAHEINQDVLVEKRKVPGTMEAQLIHY